MKPKELQPVIEFDDVGSFRIIAFGKEGDWTHYQGIAHLDVTVKEKEQLLVKSYIAVSYYYLGSIPVETVLEIKPVSTTIKSFDGKFRSPSKVFDIGKSHEDLLRTPEKKEKDTK